MGLGDTVSGLNMPRGEKVYLGAVYFLIGDEFIAVLDVISRSVDKISVSLHNPLK